MTDLAENALALADIGLRVFPLQAREKKPIAGTHGLTDASCELGQVAAWWKRWPEANIGLVTGAASGCFVLDLDGDVGIESLLDLAARNGRLPATVRQSTGKGGHLLFAWPNSARAGAAEIRNSAGRIAPGVDVRGEGGYIVAAPSVHPSGRLYAWEEGASPFDMPFARAPHWLLQLAGPPAPAARSPRERQAAAPAMLTEGGTRYGLRALEHACQSVMSAPNGQRNNTLHRAAHYVGQVVGGQELQESVARRALEDAAARMADPFDARTIAFHVDNGLKRGMASPRYAPALRRAS